MPLRVRTPGGVSVEPGFVRVERGLRRRFAPESATNLPRGFIRHGHPGFLAAVVMKSAAYTLRKRSPAYPADHVENSPSPA